MEELNNGYFIKVYTPMFMATPLANKPLLTPEQLLMYVALKYDESLMKESRTTLEMLYLDMGHDTVNPSRSTYDRLRKDLSVVLEFTFWNLGWTSSKDFDGVVGKKDMIRFSSKSQPQNLLEEYENKFAQLYASEWRVLREQAGLKNKGVILAVFLTIMSYIFPRKSGSTLAVSPMATYMSYNRLAKETKLSVPTVTKAVQTLMDMNLLACKNYGRFINQDGKVINTPNVYARPQADGSEKEEMLAKARLMLKSYNVPEDCLR